jgi:hypothetical protein
MKKIGFVVLLFITLLGRGAFAQDQSTVPVGQVPAASIPQGPAGNDLYSQALQAYLAGNFDQAILLDSRALQADPKDAKAQALLSILVSEKDKASQTVIWIGKEGGTEMAAVNPPAPIPAPVASAPGQPVAPKRHPKGQSMSELEARVNAVVFLLERDQNSQYRELKGAQVGVQKRLDEINSRSLLGNFLFLLALLMAGAALWKSWRNGEDLRRRMSLIGREYGKDDRVVQMRKM